MNNQKKSIFQLQSTNTGKSFTIREYIQPYFNSPYHFHDLYELIFIKNSNGKLYICENIINFSNGDIYLIGPGIPHCFINDRNSKESEEMAHAIVCFFKYDFLGENFFELPEMTEIKELLKKSHLSLKFENSSESLQNTILELVNSEGVTSLLKLIECLQNLSDPQIKFKTLNNSLPKIFTKQDDNERLDKVIYYILENFKDELDSKKAASIACMNEAAFCRYFKRRTEKTFSQFVNYVRITHATKLIAQKTASISVICFECGYQNISYFNRQFKIVTGMTPVQYKIQQTNISDAINKATF